MTKCSKCSCSVGSGKIFWFKSKIKLSNPSLIIISRNISSNKRNACFIYLKSIWTVKNDGIVMM